VYIKQNYVDVFLLNVTVSEFYLICFCATYRISKSKEVLSLGPDTLITKPKKGGGIPIMPVCPDASGPNWLILEQKSSAGTQRRTQASSAFKQHCVRSLEGSGHVAVTCRLCRGS